MTTFTGIPLAGFTSNKAGPGPGQVSKCVVRQFTLTAPLAVGDVIVGAPLQVGAVVHSCTRVGGPASNLGTQSQPSFFNAAPFTPYVVTTPENSIMTVTTAGGAVGDLISIITHYLPRNA